MRTQSYFRRSVHDANFETRRFPTVAVDGIPIFDGTANEAIGACLQLASTGGGKVATANLDFLALARRNSVLRQDLEGADLVVADGMPVVWLARLSGARSVSRMAGVDLVAALFRQERKVPLRVVVYGSTQAICDVAVPVLHALGSGATVVNVINPPFRRLAPTEQVDAQDAIRASMPDVVLVALGCPVQERLIAEWSETAPGALWIGIGGTLDFYSGTRRRAPLIVQQLGFEWVVRLVQDPRRLAGRYLVRDLPVLAMLAPRAAATRFLRVCRGSHTANS